jgi:hypothetical protein
MRTGRPLTPISVTNDQRATLQSWTRRSKTAQALALRARIILACAGSRPCANGALASWTRAWKVYWMSPGRARHAR